MAALLVYFPEMPLTQEKIMVVREAGLVKYINSIRRLALGEKLVISNGEGLLLYGKICYQDKSSFKVEVVKYEQRKLTIPQVTIFQAILKADQANLALDFQTEAGVDHIVPWIAERTIVKWDTNKQAKVYLRWKEIIKSAAMQSRRPFIPKLSPIETQVSGLAKHITAIQNNQGIVLVLHEAAKNKLKDLVAKLNLFQQVGIIVGPEGGLTGKEIEFLQKLDCKVVELGPNILKGGVAALVVFGILGMATSKWECSPISF